MTEESRQIPNNKWEEKQSQEKDNKDNVSNVNMKANEHEKDDEGQLPGNGEDSSVEDTGGVSSDEEAKVPTEAELQSRIEELEREKQELMGRLLRLQADFDNYRKRMRAEKELLEENANFNLIQKLLPVVDNLERASLSSTEANEAVVEGVAMITRQFLEILKKEGVEPMDCQGKPFDPNYHEAVVQEKNPDYSPGTVIEEIQKGYFMKDRVLRISMVKVSGE
ncbi:MAG: nucleotide exchange factor GrpE [Firmicutes bacterium]|nr:nucleotide exchange factor GrpE [Bacillota bacterium]